MQQQSQEIHSITMKDGFKDSYNNNIGQYMSSQYNSQKFTNWQPQQSKQHQNETINSEESILSDHHYQQEQGQDSQIDSKPESELNDQILQNNQIILQPRMESIQFELQKSQTPKQQPVMVNPMQQSIPNPIKQPIDQEVSALNPVNHSQLDGTLVEIQKAFVREESQTNENKSYIQQPVNQLQQIQMIQSEKMNQSNQVENSSFEKSNLEGKRAPRKIKQYTFFYDQIGKNQCEVIPPQFQHPFFSHLFWQTIFPLMVAWLIYLINYFIQQRVNDYCYITNNTIVDNNLCPCSNFGVRIWSFIRQMIYLKLAMILYRRHVLYQVCQNSSSQRNPKIETILLFSITIVLDFIFVMATNVNRDWVFLIIVYCTGLVCVLSQFRIRDWLRIFDKGRALILYDAILIGLLCYIFFAIPNLINHLNQTYTTFGTQLLFYIYPFLDFGIELFFDCIISSCQYAELYIYQAQLLLIGLRVGILMILPFTTFEFWYLILFLCVLRCNNSSMFLTVFIRRMAYYNCPQFMQPILSMNETHNTVKGKNGAYFEHLAWPLFLYLAKISKTTVPFYTKNFIVIINYNTPYWGQPILVWFCFAFTELMAYMCNRKCKYDNIKWFGGCGLNIIENILVRLAGYYLFYMALMTPFLVKYLDDIEKGEKNYLDSFIETYQT